MEKICLISLLKPINDVRMYQKIGMSFANRFPNTEIHLVGFYADCEKPSKKNIYFHRLFNFSRLSYKRFLAPFKVLRWLFKHKPKIIVVCTFEFLPIIVLYKIFRKTKLIYDVQENYYRNIRYTKVFPKILRVPLATTVRLIERCCHPFISDYFLAEQTYFTEMKFTQKKGIIILNKVKKDSLASIRYQKKKTSHLRLALVGTLSKDYGLHDTLKWFENVINQKANALLYITGFCTNHHDYKMLSAKTERGKHFCINIANKPIPYDSIVETMKSSDILLLPYQVNKSVENRIPTKMYEALALGLPMIIQKNDFWDKFITNNFPKASYQMVDFKNLNKVDLISGNLKAYSIKSGLYWEEEENKMWRAKCFKYNNVDTK